MASAVLANNEPNWTQLQPRGGVNFMGKVPFSNSNPNPKSSKKRQFHTAQPGFNFDGPPALMQPAASDDASSMNRRPPNDFNSGGYRTYNIASFSKKELAELKNRFLEELEQVRLLRDRINSSELQIRSGSAFQNKKPVAIPNNKKILGNKRQFPEKNFGFGGKDVKRSNHPELGQLMKKCGQILSKLMKDKHGRFIFNSPVDVVSLKLHDYHDIIKHPMDLGTVKSKLSQKLYESPLDFAADVRLTFNNAMTYNPKGHDVYSVAVQLLSRFEEWFKPIQDQLGEDDLDQAHEQEYVHVQEVQASSWDHNPKRGEFDRIKKDQENLTPIAPNYEHMAKPSPPIASNPQSTSQLPVRTPSPMRVPPVKPLKLPKPKAKDPNKRDMFLEEKHKLGLGLQSLPQEKMLQVVQIIKKRNGHLTQDGDEIELDIEAVDTETLWELDRFVTNFKKMASKMKRQALMGVNNAGAAVIDGNKDLSGNEAMDVVIEAKKPKKGDAGDEDVDIGDEMPMSSFPPIEIEKDNGHASSSSSSSSSSSDESSSSDSDSGSSSGSDSEDAHS